MESNGDETYLDGWGMSIATQRAKEHENRTPDVEVMGKTVKHGRLISQGPEIRGWGPDIRGLMSRTMRNLCSRSWMSGPMVRISGPTIPDLVWGGNFRIGGGNG